MILYFFFVVVLNIEATIHMFHFADYIFAGIHWFPIIPVWNENKVAGQSCSNKTCLYLRHNLHYCYREMQCNNVKFSETLPRNNNETD